MRLRLATPPARMIVCSSERAISTAVTALQKPYLEPPATPTVHMPLSVKREVVTDSDHQSGHHLESLWMLRQLESSGFEGRHAETLTRTILNAVSAQARIQDASLVSHAQMTSERVRLEAAFEQLRSEQLSQQASQQSFVAHELERLRAECEKLRTELKHEKEKTRVDLKYEVRSPQPPPPSPLLP